MELEKISKIKRVAIEEAIKIWNATKTETWEGRELFGKKIQKLGWSYCCTNAAYKTCYKKGSIVVKFARHPGRTDAHNEVEREFQQWKLVPSKFRRHLPKVHAFVDGMLIQDMVLKYCGSSGCCPKAGAVAKEFGCLEDWGHNHGHSRKGTVKFFDWVYNRTWDRVRDLSIDFLDK